MTKLKFYLQFFLIFFLFLLPPIIAPFFENEPKAIDFSSVSAWTAMCFAIAAFLFLQERISAQRKTLSAKASANSNSLKIQRAMRIAEFLKALGFLCAIAAAFELLGRFLKMQPLNQIIFPKTPLEFFFCGISLAAAAFYEEVMYRGYLPHALKAVNSGKTWQIAMEALAILIFAFSHGTNGIMATVNALFAGIVLRRCAVKTKGIWAGFAAHLIYNAFTLFALFA